MDLPRSRPRFIALVVALALSGLFYTLTSKGQHLIEAAQRWSTMQQVEGVLMLLRLYQGRYGALPGDDPQAPARWGRPPALTLDEGALIDLTGNRRINGLFLELENPHGEQYAAWRDLRLSGLLEDEVAPERIGYAALPPTAVGGLMGFSEQALGLEDVLCLTRIPGRLAEDLARAHSTGQPFGPRLRAVIQEGAVDPTQTPDPAVTAFEWERLYLVCLTLPR